MKHFLLQIIIVIQSLVFLPSICSGLRLYTQEQYHAAREKAVIAAREGDTKRALISLKRLLQLDPDNHGARNDYITVLIWDKQYQEALGFIPQLDLYELPEYVLRSLIIAADAVDQEGVSEQLAKHCNNRFPIAPPNAPDGIEGETADETSKQNYLAGYAATPSKKKQHDKALALISQLDLINDPEFVIDVFTESSENLGRLELQKKTSAAQKHIREQEYAEAEKIIMPLYLEGVKEQVLLKNVISLFDAQNKYMDAAYATQLLLNLDPDNKDLKRKLIFNLVNAGAPFRALELLQKEPSLFTETETNKIIADTNSLLLRWSSYTPPPGTKISNNLDSILTKMDDSINIFSSQNDRDNTYRLQSDYIVALRKKNLTKAAIGKYRELLTQGQDIPDYVLRHVASAFLEEQQAEHARDIYQQLLEQNPNDFELKVALLYAFLENGEDQNALNLITELDEETPLWRKDHSGKIRKKNNKKLQVSILAANVETYTDKLSEAQVRLEKLVETAPYNGDLRDNLATVYRLRGWHQQALAEISIAKTIEPDNPYLSINHVKTLMELYRFREAEQELDQLIKKAPYDKRFRELLEDYRLRDKRQFMIWVDYGSSDGEDSDQGSSDLSIESYLYDKYYGYNFRPYIHQYYTQSEFPEGTGSYKRLGIGTEYRRNSNIFGVELSSNFSDSSNLGISLNSTHNFTDQFLLSLGYDSFSTKIPVRAYFDDITGSGFKADITYKFHESSNFSASYEYLDFSDNNKRNSWSMSFQQRVLNSPKFKMTLVPLINLSQNSEEDTNYYNPEEDHSINLLLKNEWFTYQNYDMSFKQTLELSFGQYHQENYGTEPIGALVYQHDWNISKTLKFYYGIKYSQNHYDSEKENRLAGFTSFNWTF